MTQAPVGLPPHLLPRSKAAPSSSSTASLHAVSSSTTPQLSRASSRNRQDFPATAAASLPVDSADKATATLIRRVLCPQAHVGPSDSRPVDELLPPLTSSNDVDLQLYAIISIIVKEFVYTWYGKITPDQGFVEEVVRIFAHCTRALEQRVRKLDIEELILDEIPHLVAEHVNAFRTSHQLVYPSSLSIAVDPKLVYHTLVPHPAFSPAPGVKAHLTADEQSQNEGAYRQLLVQGALAVLLPTEDLGNRCLRTLVADVIGDLILGNGIGNKACEGWLIWEGITKFVESVNARNKSRLPREEMELDTRSRLEKFGLLSDRSGSSKQDVNRRRTSSLSDMIWRLLQYGYLTFLALRFVVVGLHAAFSRPLGAVPASVYRKDEDSVSTNSATALSWKRPILSFEIFSLVSIMLDLPDRTPWLLGSLRLLQHHLVRRPLSLGATGGLFDNFLRDLLATHLFHPTRLPPLLQTLRTSIFPNNALAPARVTPSVAEQAAMKLRCAKAIVDLIPAVVARRFFAAPVALRRGFSSHVSDQDESGQVCRGEVDPRRAQMLAEVEEVLDTFGDSYMNKHLIFGIVELCIVRLLPEVGERSVRELMETRLGEGWEEKE